MFNVTFFGAAQEVTGSMHLLEVDGKFVALDCGMFQGKRDETEGKNKSFPMDPAKIDAVVLSHAHIDHCGRLPLLVKLGFKGPIFSTPGTHDLAALLMVDSAHIQEEDAKFISKKRSHIGKPPVEPLYTQPDAIKTAGMFKTCMRDQDFVVVPNLKAHFRDAGHMLGSAHISLAYARDGAAPVTLDFTGDLGRFGQPILNDPSPLPPCDYLITESTYGARRHETTANLPERLAKVVNDTASRGGKIIIPAFSVGRTQVVVYELHQLLSKKLIPQIPIFVDSPLAVNASEVFRNHPELYDTEAAAFQKSSGDILGCDSCNYIREVQDSKNLNNLKGSCVIISASGMCENGRIVHHLRNNIGDPKNTILIVGYQAANTLGRRIVERQPTVFIFGEKLPLRAEVVVLEGFSGHADCDELRRLNQPLAKDCKTAFLVHGELDQMKVMKETMQKNGYRRVEVPPPKATFRLDGE